jgi:hypothetical protein
MIEMHAVPIVEHDAADIEATEAIPCKMNPYEQSQKEFITSLRGLKA